MESLGAGGGDARPYEIAGGRGRRSRAWYVGNFGPNTAINYALDELRRKSRDQARKNPYASAAIDKIVSNTVGTGIVPTSRAPDEGFRNAISNLWLDWTDQADSTGAYDFYGLQAVAVRGMIEGGEAFIRLRTRRVEDGLTVPLQLQVMEGDHCPYWNIDAASNIRQGIQYNAIGQRTGYYLYREHPGDGLINGVAQQDPVFVTADDICHLYKGARPGQDRGEPWLTRALRTLYDLDGYFDAELVRKKFNAAQMGWIKRPEPDTSSGVAPLGADDADETGASSLPLVPGTMQVLLEGEDVVLNNPIDAGNFEMVVRQYLRAIATAVGITYEDLTGDYSQLNDRTMRAALNGFRRTVEMWQHQLVVYQFCRKVWVRWIDLALMSGALTLPANMPRRLAYAVDWIPQRWPYIQPVQDIEAQQAEVQAGFTSRTRQVRMRGDDSATIDAENAADNKRADVLKVSYTSDGRHEAAKPAISPAVPAPPKSNQD